MEQAERLQAALDRLAHGGTSPRKLQQALDVIGSAWNPLRYRMTRIRPAVSVLPPQAREVWLVVQRARAGPVGVRRRALYALRFVGPHAAMAVPTLLSALEDVEPMVRLSSAQTLAWLPCPPAALPVLRRVLRGDALWSVRWCAARALIRAGTLEEVEDGLLATARPDHPVWQAVVQALPHRTTALQRMLDTLQEGKEGRRGE